MTILGIDLGTTNSACGIWRDGKVQLIPNRLGDILTPSVVGIDTKGAVVVGKIAREHLISRPNETVAAFKRRMGTAQKLTLGSLSMSATEVSSLVLKSLKEDAETFLGEDITDAIISVPAYFNDNQRHATKEAAELAGLKVQRLINEPTAAALAYGVQEKEEGTIIVLDMGGGTFDVSILEYFDGIMEVHASAGDNFLGGEDFTDAIVKDFIKQSNSDTSPLPSPFPPALREELYRKAEAAKLSINRGKEAEIKMEIDGKSYSESYDSARFATIALPLLARVKQPIEMALRDAELHPSKLDDVILVGGATRMSLLRNAIGKMFARIPTTTLDPDQVVAMGAAIQAGLREKNEDLDDVVLTDVCPYSLGTEVVNPLNQSQGGYFLPIIERNRTVPVSIVETLSTVVDNQKAITINIYQGESRQVKKNIHLGDINVKIPKAKAGVETVDLRYSYDMNGLLEVDVTVVSTGQKYFKAIEQAPGALSDSEMEKARSRLAQLKFHPREEEENRRLIARGEVAYEAAKGDQRKYIGDVMAHFEAILDKQNPHDIIKARTELDDLLKEFETDLWQ